MKVDRQTKKPYYIQIYEKLRLGIQEDRFRRGDYLPSENELAQRFEVDRQTIRRSLELLVNDGIVEKKPGVGTVVKDFTRAGRRDDSERGNIAFILPKRAGLMDRLSEPFNANLFIELDQLFSEQGLQLMYCAVETENDLAVFIDRNQVVGIVFVSSLPAAVYAYARNRSIPALVDGLDSDVYPSVQGDSEAGVLMGVSRLAELGHRRIAFLGGLEGYHSTRARYAGYCRALANAGIAASEQTLKYGDWTFDSGYVAMNEILDEAENLPTAVFACNDMMAAGAVEAIRNAGLSVPEDLSVLGHDDIDQCIRMRPRLTTLRVERDLTSRAICRNLLWSVQSGEIDVYKVVIPCRLIERESIGPAPRS